MPTRGNGYGHYETAGWNRQVAKSKKSPRRQVPTTGYFEGRQRGSAQWNPSQPAAEAPGLNSGGGGAGAECRSEHRERVRRGQSPFPRRANSASARRPRSPHATHLTDFASSRCRLMSSSLKEKCMSASTARWRPAGSPGRNRGAAKALVGMKESGTGAAHGGRKAPCNSASNALPESAGVAGRVLLLLLRRVPKARSRARGRGCELQSPALDSVSGVLGQPSARVVAKGVGVVKGSAFLTLGEGKSAGSVSRTPK